MQNAHHGLRAKFALRRHASTSGPKHHKGPELLGRHPCEIFVTGSSGPLRPRKDPGCRSIIESEFSIVNWSWIKGKHLLLNNRQCTYPFPSARASPWYAYQPASSILNSLWRLGTGRSWWMVVANANDQCISCPSLAKDTYPVFILGIAPVRDGRDG